MVWTTAQRAPTITDIDQAWAILHDFLTSFAEWLPQFT